MEKPSISNYGRFLVGAALILFGALILLARVLDFPIGRHFWPFLLLLGGLMFFVRGILATGYFLGRKHRGSEGLLFPGTYLIIIGLMFIFLNITDWEYMRFLWPTFILGVAVSLGMIYAFTPSDFAERRRGLRSGMLTLTVLSIAFYFLAARASLLWPVILIAVGLIVIFGGFRKKQSN